jgi:predicted MFS family arabinose efflux permease
VVCALGVTQIISWGSMFYAFSVVLKPIEQETGWTRDAIVGAFSLSLLVAGVAAAPIGLLIDRWGGRVVMSFGSAIAAVVLLVMSQAQTMAAFYGAWAALGMAGAMLLYEPAFAVIYRSFGSNARTAITALTLVAGFASTVFWPLTQALVGALGWRYTLVVLGVLNLAVCLPLHAFVLPRKRKRHSRPAESHAHLSQLSSKRRKLRSILNTKVFWLLAFAFTANILPFSSLSVHLIPLLQEKGFSPADAVWLAALVGPMQVGGRVVQFTLGRRFSPQHVGLLALSLLPVGLMELLLASSGLFLSLVFVFLYGASNGVMTIVRATIPAEMFGRDQYGAVNGALAAPVITCRAAGPLAASLIWTMSGGYGGVVCALAGASVLAMAAFYLALKAQPSESD